MKIITIKLIILISIFVMASCNHKNMTKISVEEYQSKVYASWIAQIIGNIYGLPHENQHIENPGPDNFPYGYQGSMERMREVGGAFSDDDTDFEYMYILTMEEKGLKPTYSEIAKKWKYHVRDRVWLANRAALAAMHYGYTPPVTGNKKINPHWFQIDPQLINEIWAVVAPGMDKYAAEKSRWAAKITNDDWGVEPTIHYGAMYAAAFYESNINKLIEIGNQALPENSRFRRTVEDMKKLYQKYPDNWKKARDDMAQKYYNNEPEDTKTIWNANLNGACGILALLYGEGDFQKTLDLACAMGFDADNQAATMAGLLGIANGFDNIPKNLMFPFEEWEQPFNNIYVNVSRFDLPDVELKDLAERTAKLGEKLILEKGGQIITEDGKEYYLINRDAEFIPHLEFPNSPLPYIEKGKKVDYKFYVSGGEPPLKWKITRGKLPRGLSFNKGKLSGIAKKAGTFPVEIQVSDINNRSTKEFELLVREKNIAPQAKNIIASVTKTDIAKRDSMWLSVPYSLYANNVDVINDGKKFGEGSTFYSICKNRENNTDYYGYEWLEKKSISILELNTGSVEENGGWFTSLDVEYRNKNGEWEPVEKLSINPSLADGNKPFNKPNFVTYMLKFEPVKTSAIRIIGEAGGTEHWFSKFARFTSITELTVH